MDTLKNFCSKYSKIKLKDKLKWEDICNVYNWQRIRV